MRTKATRVATFFTLLLLGIAVSAQPAQAQLGISGGLNFNNLGDIEGDADATFDNSTGWHVGVFADIGAGPITLRPGVFYHKIGTYEFATEEFDITAIEVPIDLRFKVLPTPVVKPYLLAGPVLTFPQSEGGFEGTEDVSVTGDIGAGLEFTLPGVGLTLMPELRYSIGITKFLQDDFEVGDVTFSPDNDDQRLSAVMLRLNVKF